MEGALHSSCVGRHLERQLSFSALDRHFSRFLTALSGRSTPDLYYASALLSRHVSEGHVCLDLSAWAGRRIVAGDAPDTAYTAPAAAAWRTILAESGVVGAPGEFKPLVLDDRFRLYFYRYWEYQTLLADRIRRLALRPLTPLIRRPDADSIAGCFSAADDPAPDWQKIAALMACLKPFLVITGSPGTGKTTVVARILSQILESAPAGGQRIALAAPTGKAAFRLQEAIRSVKRTLSCGPAVQAGIPETASTVHRLLGSLPGSSRFRHDRGNPLPFETVVIDEASMLDLPLLAKLVRALPETAGLILLGDKNQLASVEAGAVLSDICGPSPANRFSSDMIAALTPFTGASLYGSVATASAPGVHDCIIHLQTNYRFEGDSDIARISEAVNRGDGAQALKTMTFGSGKQVSWLSLPAPNEIERTLAPLILKGFRGYLELGRAGGAEEDIFAAFEGFRVLCALRQGPFGVETVNRRIENILQSERLIERRRPYYCGQPLMITRNHPQLGLYNGDIGLVLPDPDRDGELSAVFPEAPGSYRRFSPWRLPECETAYAITVHKSQGSEFDSVLLILSDQDAPVLSRELVYTGITRARKQVRIASAEQIFVSAVSRRIARTSGLQDALWPNRPENDS
jgi:exodeoxyribonuclease V alpha subunit